MKSLFPYAIGPVLLGLAACDLPPSPEQTVYMQNLGFELRWTEEITTAWYNPETGECAFENSWDVYPDGFSKPNIFPKEKCGGF